MNTDLASRPRAARRGDRHVRANRPRMDAVALLMLTVLPFTGVLTMSEALAGFADANVVLIATLFVIGEGLRADRGRAADGRPAVAQSRQRAPRACWCC